MRRRVLALVILLVGMAFVVYFSLAYTAKPTLKAENFPHTLAGLELTGAPLTGPAAAEEISKLHGTDIPVQNAYLAQYGKGEQKVFIWIAEGATVEEAGKLLLAMDQKMPTNKVFTDYRQVQGGGDTFYYVRGLGMDNYYFQDGRRVYWVALANIPGDSFALVQQIRRTFKNYQ